MKEFLNLIIELFKSLFCKKEEIEIPENQEDNDIQEEIPPIEIEQEEENNEIEIIPIEEENEIMKNTTLKLILERIFSNNVYTIGHLYVDGKYFCDTIEDTDRGLTDEMSEAEIKEIKVYSETAIPYGTYDIDMNTVSSKYSNFTKYKWAKPYDAKIPRLLNVKGFSGILIHCGNTEKDTCGCLIVGENKEKGKVINSTITFNRLMNEILLPAVKDEKKISIEIVKKASC